MTIEKKAKIKLLIAVIASVIIVLIVLLSSYYTVIFQRGNPIPYLIASMNINEENTYVEVGENSGVYIAKKGECPELFQFIEEKWDTTFVEQAGSGFIFSDGINNLTISSEIYWGRFTVWQVPQKQKLT